MVQDVNGPNGFKVGREVFVDKDNNLTTTRNVESNSIFTTTKDSSSHVVQESIIEYDKDGDGKTDYKEVSEYTHGLRDLKGNKYTKETTEIDADGDGKIDYKTETIRYESGNEKITKIDYNGDGQYDKTVSTELHNNYTQHTVDIDNDGDIDYVSDDLSRSDNK